jgi:hypothetical protein
VLDVNRFIIILLFILLSYYFLWIDICLTVSSKEMPRLEIIKIQVTPGHDSSHSFAILAIFLPFSPKYWKSGCYLSPPQISSRGRRSSKLYRHEHNNKRHQQPCLEKNILSRQAEIMCRLIFWPGRGGAACLPGWCDDLANRGLGAEPPKISKISEFLEFFQNESDIKDVISF